MSDKMEETIDSIPLYDIEKIENDFYFTEEGRQNAVNNAMKYNKMIIFGQVNNDLKYLNYVHGILMPYIITEDNHSEWENIRHKFVTNKYTAIVEFYNQLKTAKIIDENICNEIESALNYIIFRFDKIYTRLEIDESYGYFFKGREWINNYLNNKGEFL